MKQHKIWTLEQAKEDYLMKHPRKLEKKTCKDCMFSKIDFYGDVRCCVKEKNVFFTKKTAGKCKYFNSKFPYKKYRK